MERKPNTRPPGAVIRPLPLDRSSEFQTFQRGILAQIGRAFGGPASAARPGPKR